MDATARGRGGAAQVEAGVRGAIGAQRGPGEHAGERHGATRDIAATQVRVPGGEVLGVPGPTCEDHVAESRSEALHLVLDSFRAVRRGTRRHVAVGPGGVPSCRCTRGVEEAGLHQKKERLVVRGRGKATVKGVVLGTGHFVEGAAEMHRGGPFAGGCRPGNRLGERVIDLEDARAAGEVGEPCFVGRGERIAGDLAQGMGRGVEQGDVGWRQIAQGADRMFRDDLAAQGAQMSGQGVGERLRAAGENWPA